MARTGVNRAGRYNPFVRKGFLIHTAKPDVNGLNLLNLLYSYFGMLYNPPQLPKKQLLT